MKHATFSCYVCAPYDDAAFVRVIHERLTTLRVWPMSRWAEQANGPEDFSKYTPEKLREAAKDNDSDVGRADVLLVVARPAAGGEMFAEARLGLTYGRPVVWVGRRTLSAWRDGVVRAEDLDDAFSRLVAMRNHFENGLRGFVLAEKVAS